MAVPLSSQLFDSKFRATAVLDSPNSKLQTIVCPEDNRETVKPSIVETRHTCDPERYALDLCTSLWWVFFDHGYHISIIGRSSVIFNITTGISALLVVVVEVFTRLRTKDAYALRCKHIETRALSPASLKLAPYTADVKPASR